MDKFMTSALLAVILFTFRPMYAQDSQSTGKYATRILLREKQLEFKGTILKTKKREVIKILRREGLGAASVGIFYRSETDKFKIKDASIQLPDGKIIKLKSSDIKDLPFTALGNNYFSDRRKVTLTFPQAVVGSVIDYTTETVSDRSVFRGDFSVSELLLASVPVDSFYWSLRLDKESRPRAFFRFEHTDSLIPDINEDEKTIRYVIRRSALSPFNQFGREPEPYMMVSTWKTWNDFIQWWIPLYSDKLQVSDSMRITVDQLIKDKTDAFEKAKAVTEWVKDRVRYVAVEYGDGGFEPRKASYTFTQKYGDCKDKAVLAIAMLKYAGIEAYPVLVSVGLKPVNEFPAQQFNHAIICVKLDTNLIFFDPTNTSYDFGYVSYFYAFEPQALIRNGAVEFVTAEPLMRLDENAVYMWLRQSDDLLAGTMRVFAYGKQNLTFKRDYDKPRTLMRDAFIEGALRSNNLIFAADFDTMGYTVIDKDSSFIYADLTCKPVQYDYDDLKFVNLEFFITRPGVDYKKTFKQKKAFQFSQYKGTYHIEFTVDSGYQVVSVPHKKTLNNLFGIFRRDYTADDHTIRITAVEELHMVDFKLEDYDTDKINDFLEYEAYENSSLNDFVVLKRKQ